MKELLLKIWKIVNDPYLGLAEKDKRIMRGKWIIYPNQQNPFVKA